MNSSSTMSLSILLSLKDQASQALGGIGQAIAGLFTGNPQQLLAGIGQTLMAVGTVAVGFGEQSVQMAAQYQQSMNMVQALTGSSGQQMQWYSQQVENLAINAGAAPNDLAQGLYNVLSASYKGKEAMNVLTLATEDSKIGMTSATVTTDSLTNILRSFSVTTKNVTATNGEMLETVTLGKSTFEQYATTIVKAASSSVQFHVSMETMNAAWSTMTSSGIRAAQASTDYQQSLKVMYGNIGTVTTSLHKSGIAFNEAKFNTMTYGQKVMYLNTALQEANDRHVKVTGVTIQASQAISTIATHIGDYNSNLSTLSNKQQMAEKTQNAWKITQQGFNQQLSQAKSAFQVLEITVGQALLPVLTSLMKKLTPIIMSFIHWLTQSHVLQNAIHSVIGAISTLIATGGRIIAFFQHNQTAMDGLKAVLVAVGTIILISMVTAFVSWAIAAGAAAIATLAATWPLLALAAIVAIVVFAVIEAVQHWGAIVGWLKGVWGGIVSFFTGIWNFIVSIFKKYGLDILMVLTGPIGAIVILIVTHWNKVKAFLVTAWNDLVNLARTLWSDVTGVFTAAWDGISSALHSLWSKIWSLVTAWPGQMLALGGKIIQFLINGITGAIGGVKNAVGSVWHTISNFFPHSPPKEGPGTDLPNWGPRLVSQFGKGIEQSAPGLKASLGVLMTPVAQSLGAPQVGGGGVSGAQTAASGASAGGGITINLTVQARVIDRRTIKAIMEQIADELRSNGVLSSLATGGTH